MTIDIHTAHFHIRTVTAAGKKIYMPLRAETSDVAAAYGASPEYMETMWKSVINSENESDMVVFKDDTFVAICSFQDFAGDHVEIGYDVVKEYRRQGIGKALAADLVSIAHSTFPDKEVLVSVREENAPS